MKENFRHWLLDMHLTTDKSLREAGAWNNPNPSPVFSVHDETNPQLRAVVEWLAKELELWTPADNRLEKNPLLKKAMYHLVGVAHPTAGSGGELQFDIVSRISKEVLKAAKEHHPDGRLDFDGDETLQMASSPVTLIKFLKSQWGRFHPKAGWEGGYGKTGEDYDRYFLDRDRQFKDQHYRQHFAEPQQQGQPQSQPQSQSQKGSSPHGTINVMKVMQAMPHSFFAGKDVNQIMAAAIEIAHNLQQSPPGVKEIQEFMVAKGLVGENN